MGIESLPIDLVLTWQPSSRRWEGAILPAALLTTHIPKPVSMSTRGNRGARRLSVGPHGNDLLPEIEAAAFITVTMSDMQIIYEGGFQGDTITPYAVSITEDAYVLLQRGVTNPALRTVTVRLDINRARPMPAEMRAGLSGPAAIVDARPAPLEVLARLPGPTALKITPARPAPIEVLARLRRPAVIAEARPVPLALDAIATAPHASSDLVSFETEIRASSPRKRVLTAIEITHPATLQPVRLVNDTRNARIDGQTYTACRFEARLSNDEAQRAPRAEIAIGNVGRQINDWVELTGGGAGGEVRIMQLLEGANEVDWEMTMDLAGMSQSSEVVTATLGFDPLLGRPAVAIRYDPQTAPGLF